MAWELLTDTPPLLREGHIIRFVGAWPEDKRGRWFRVDLAQQIKYDVTRIVTSGGSGFDVDFRAPSGGGVSDSQISLLPERANTAYEVLLGLKGNPLVLPIYNNTYYLKLETNQVIPTLTDARLRYLGFWDEDDTPFDQPRLRDYLVHDQEPPVLRLYSDTDLDERLTLRFIVNRMMVTEIDQTSLSEDLKRLARMAKHHSLFNY